MKPPQEAVAHLLAGGRVKGWALALAGILVGAPSVSAQAFGVPTSDRLVVAELTLPAAGRATVEVREGTLLTIKNQDYGYMIGLSPAIDGLDGHVALLVVDVQETGLESHVEFLTQVDLPVGGSDLIGTFMGDIGIRILEVRTGSFPRQPAVEHRHMRPRDLRKRFGATAGGVCCVTCGAWTICGSSVQLSCGSCDSGGGHSM